MLNSYIEQGGGPGTGGGGTPAPLPDWMKGLGDATGGLSTFGGVNWGNKFWRGPGDLFQAFRNGLVNPNDTGDIYFGAQGPGGAAPAGAYRVGRALFSNEQAYKDFMANFGNRAPGSKVATFLNAILGQYPGMGG